MQIKRKKKKVQKELPKLNSKRINRSNYLKGRKKQEKEINASFLIIILLRHLLFSSIKVEDVTKRTIK